MGAGAELRPEHPGGRLRDAHARGESFHDQRKRATSSERHRLLDVEARWLVTTKNKQTRGVPKK